MVYGLFITASQAVAKWTWNHLPLLLLSGFTLAHAQTTIEAIQTLDESVKLTENEIDSLRKDVDRVNIAFRSRHRESLDKTVESRLTALERQQRSK
jgi:GTPase